MYTVPLQHEVNPPHTYVGVNYTATGILHLGEGSSESHEDDDASVVTCKYNWQPHHCAWSDRWIINTIINQSDFKQNQHEIRLKMVTI